MRYLYVDPPSLKKNLSPEAVYIWIPVQLVKFADCNPKELYIVDCFFSSLVNNPYASLMFLRKIPKPKNIKITDTPSIEAKKVSSECRDVMRDFNDIIDSIITNNYEKLYDLLDITSEYKDVEFTVRRFFRSKKYVVKAETVREMDRRLAIDITKKLMSKLCMYNEKEHKRVFTSVTTERCYALAYIDPVLRLSGIALGKKFIEIKTYLKFTEKLDLEKLLAS